MGIVGRRTLEACFRKEIASSPRFHPGVITCTGPVVAGACLLALAALGCGSEPKRLPPAAEPAKAPPLSRRPAGRVVPVGNRPEGVAADPRTGLVAVGLTHPHRLALVDARSGRVVRRLRLPAPPRHLQLAGRGGPVLVPAERADALVEVSLPGGRTTSTGVGRFPHDATAAGRRVVVADEFGDSVSVIERGRVIKRMPAPVQPGGVAAAGGDRVGVIAVRERVLQLYDARALKPLARVPAGVGPTHLVSDGVDRFWVADTDGDAVLYVHVKPRLEVVRRVALAGAPYGMAIDLERRRLWVTLTERNRVVELTANGQPRVIRVFPTVRQPNTVAVDPKSGRVFVASRSDGTLQLLDPDRARSLPRR